jgi:ferritin-like metal-binding protein YciE
METRTMSRRTGTRSRTNLLEKFFVKGLKDIYWAENHIVKALPKLQKAASSPQLQKAFQEHLQVTQNQIKRLDEVFQKLGTKAEGKKCEAMKGLLEEGESVIQDTENNTSTRDVGLIIAAQKVEHYEIAAYGGLSQLARTLGHDDVAQLLRTTLDEESRTDKQLTEIAENNINYEASSEEK